jgi:tRNA pseudouridine38-40 synthase
MRSLKMTVAYVGTPFAGWQVQPRLATVQGILEDRLSRMLQESVRIAGAGRTDAGVHARGQVASFRTASRIPTEGLRRGLNARLPHEIRIMQVEEVPEGFHARADARCKEYRYRIALREPVSPFEAPFVASVRGPLDVEAMRRAAVCFIGRHDFSSFCPAGCVIEDRRRSVIHSGVVEQDGQIEYQVRADGFLRHMVRTLVGTLVLVGKGRLGASAIPGILAARDRAAAGPCAPPQGLVLEKVFYGEGS